MIIQEVPNLSRSIAKRIAKKVSCIGINISAPWRPESSAQQFERFVQRLRESTLASRGNSQKRPTLR
jgi:hypothetical protein